MLFHRVPPSSGLGVWGYLCSTRTCGAWWRTPNNPAPPRAGARYNPTCGQLRSSTRPCSAEYVITNVGPRFLSLTRLCGRWALRGLDANDGVGPPPAAPRCGAIGVRDGHPIRPGQGRGTLVAGSPVARRETGGSPGRCQLPLMRLGWQGMPQIKWRRLASQCGGYPISVAPDFAGGTAANWPGR